MTLVEVPTQTIVDWESFHDVLARALRFPEYYGRNGDAFIDCLRDIVEGRDAAATLAPGETLTVDLGDVAAFRERCPDQFGALVDWTAHVNADSIYYGEARRVALAFSG